MKTGRNGENAMIGKRWKTAAAALAAFAVLWTSGPGIAAARIPERVTVGGVPFGVRFPAEGVVVIGFSAAEEGELNPAYAAGLRQGDVITAVDGEAVTTAEELTERINAGGGLVEITYLRDREEKVALLCPRESENGRRAGMWIRDTVAGIGTVTFLLEDDLSFGGLGHGICRGDTGELLSVPDAEVTEVTITGVVKGAPGEPGELRGVFTGERRGRLNANTECGVFGVYEKSLPDGCGKTVPVAPRDEVHPGRASILCTLEGREPGEYEICITDIDRRSRNNRSFSVVVTDRDLLERTGGIVQGMSGSPILQDGRLVGAVTHVLVGDPAEGYGIFIDNMFEAMGA